MKSKILLLASYCDGGDNCTDDNPCPECLDMCNVFTIDLSDTRYKYLGMFREVKQGYGRQNNDD